MHTMFQIQWLHINFNNTKNHHTLHGVMEEYLADDDLEKCNAPHTNCNTQKFPFNTKTRIKTCIGIEVSYLKCE
jgi:hypothetical protein